MSRQRRWVYDLSDRLPAETVDVATLLGGKGASLRTMRERGFQVPAAFTIITDACQAYLESDRTWPAGLWEQILDAVEQLELETGRRFGQTPSPLLFAVRSGAAVSMPGMLQTVLNCGLNLDLAAELGTETVWHAYADFIGELAVAHDVELSHQPIAMPGSARELCMLLLDQYETLVGKPFPQKPMDLLGACISAVFDSWHSRRAVAYRHAHGLDRTAGTAVNVQVMIETDAAGVLFSRDPRNRMSDVMVVEAIRGLGHRLVSGTATPDRYVFDRDACPPAGGEAGECTDYAGREFGVADADNDVLDNSHLRELCGLGIRLEQHFGHAVDVEWGYANDRFVLFQCRAMDDDVSEHVQMIRLAEVERLKRLAKDNKTQFWVRHSLDETLPAPTPLTWDIVRRFMSGDGGFGRLYRDLGYTPSRRVCRDGFLELVCGRIYADPDRMAEMFCEGLPFRYDADALRDEPGYLNRAPTRFDPERTDALFLFRLPKIAWTLCRSAGRLRRGANRAADHFDEKVLPPYLDFVKRERSRAVKSLGITDLVDLLERRRSRVLDEFAAEALKPGLSGGMALAAVESRLTQCLGPKEAMPLTRSLVAGLANEESTEQDAMLYRLGRGEIELSEFLEHVGHRGPGEMELAEPRWREIPDTVLRTADSLRQSGSRCPIDLAREAAGRRSEAVNELPELLRERGASSLYRRIERQLRLAQRLLPYRETARHYFMMGYELIREVIEQLARRSGLGHDIYFLRYAEVQQLSHQAKGLQRAIEERRVRWQILQRLPIPDVVEPEGLDVLSTTTLTADEVAMEIDAVALSNGSAQGPVLVVTDPRQPVIAAAGYVLVCPAIDPGFTPLLLRAAGLIVERGGILSHGAVVARQLGIPAVAVTGAATILGKGEAVVVDGDWGRVLRKRAQP